ncbi:glucose-1-phosphate adenylyltransferase [Leptospira kobayashii]|uniref:Glucose-1-phosphate adenylyltransferase n=1 Tax=Leptospira kobayashii TaxID=1917830 RepID=A0ABN6KEF3_9LEPT|nr:sugar phosphate nucleotidyltransferase [Leptospira kobayashii]BDA79075.1 glucose-1-phosphate adenylyltransferase [Leptospira kobayashii]
MRFKEDSIDSVDFILRKDEVLTVILGGGKGTRLLPLTEKRSKPAVSFGGKYRLIDIPISNSLNSGFEKIFVLTQFNSYSLNRHIHRTYSSNSINQKSFVEIIAAEQTVSSVNWFEGTADAVRKVLPYIREQKPKYVLILSGDQLYNMDLANFMQTHLSDPDTEISVASNGVSEEQIYGLGIVKTTEDGFIREFIEKPQDIHQVESCKQPNGSYLANMGIYIFNTKTLIEVLEDPGMTDFGKEILPKAIREKKVKSYVYEGYWEDIGTIRAFYEANLMLTDDVPKFNLYLEKTPFYTRPRSLPPTKINQAVVNKALISEGTILNRCEVHRSVIGVRQYIDQGTKIYDSVIMGLDNYGSFDRVHGKIPNGIGPDCEIRNAIVDKDCAIGTGVKLLNLHSYTEYEDEFVKIRDGIIVVPRHTTVPDGYSI